ncbi:MAG: M55 family metallopeptidase [Planctomycetes bacterium]|nr:M55 family metallopeptidase [Planctomycetota bacterium]
MRIFISADMDGITGITHPDQMFEGRPGYLAGCEAMTADVSAAIEGTLRAEPAAEFVVADGHSQGRNLFIEKLHESASLVCGPMHESVRPLSQAQGMEGCDLAFFIGYHAKAGTPGGLLAHTWAGPVIADVRLNGVSVGETGINAAVAGHWDMPLGLVSGAHDLRPEVEALECGTLFAQTKQSYGRTAALCLPAKKSRETISRTAQGAVEAMRSGGLRPYKPTLPMVMEVDTHRREQADKACRAKGTERAGERTIRVTAESTLQATLTMWEAMCRAQDEPPNWLT